VLELCAISPLLRTNTSIPAAPPTHPGEGGHEVTRAVALALLLSVCSLPAVAQPRPGEDETFFELRIRPVLAGTCSKCHGGEKTSAGLRVNSRSALLKGGESGAAVVPGQPEKSLLILALRQEVGTEVRMPPGKKLPDAVIADFTTWVRRGAPWPAAGEWANSGSAGKHWAFQPVRKPLPPPDPSGWAAGPVDRFIAVRLREQGLRPVASADRRTLLRRVTFDLTGLPPTPAEVSAFLNDSSPDAYARVVDRLLASPSYGERWGRHWLDVTRYADTAGDNADYPVPEIYRYRDYVIDAFNADKPYDEFVREQLAGDLLARQGPPERYAERVVATGFLALSRRYATAPYELWHLTLEDTIDTVGQSFLGLTLRCARCHDHKFDPVTTADYYALYGIFNSTQFPYAGSEELASMKRPREHFVALLPPDRAATETRAYTDGTAKLRAEVARLEKTPPSPKRDAELNKRKQELVLRERPGLPPGLPGAYAVSDGKAADVSIQRRGDPAAPGPVVRRAAPQFLAGGRPLDIPPGQSGRLQLAQWLTRPENPLTARVMVNRIWQHHFGRGLVGTPNNLGQRGEAPTHPELLDYLAAYFVEKGWSVKAVHRLILLSKTYQLASAEDPSNAALDPGNRWYWRHDRLRLEAEAIRDAMLALGGTLNRNRPGAHPFPPASAWGWTQHHPFKEVYPSNHRSVYLMTQRLQRHPFLALFDGPDTNTTTEKRAASTVPQQALYLMNSPAVRAEAEAFARRLLAAAPDTAGRIRLAYELAFARPPRPEELVRGTEYLAAYQDGLRRAAVPPDRVPVEAWLSYARVLFSANEFVYVD
jgi:hypothetical protein